MKVREGKGRKGEGRKNETFNARRLSALGVSLSFLRSKLNLVLYSSKPRGNGEGEHSKLNLVLYSCKPRGRGRRNNGT